MVMAVVLAIYGFVDLLLLLAMAQVERVKALIRSLGARSLKRAIAEEKTTEGMCQLEDPIMRFTKINAKGQVTIPADLRERFGIIKGTCIDWRKDGGRLVLTPIKPRRKKS